uniref:Glycosyl transferase group 1 n=1 Tax=Marinomonas sp. (strain MWYL1) TaxID=400668 RepID=A6VTG0_MARMS
MKILFNCTSNTVGGGAKNAAIFIKFAIENKDFLWEFAVSTKVKAILEMWKVDCSKMYLFESSPAKNRGSRRRLRELSEFLDVDLVYTMAGPAYVNFPCKHVLGMSEPYVSHAGWAEICKGRSLFKAIKTVGLTAYKAFFANKADFWVFQTDYSKKSFSNRYFISPEKTVTIYNAIDMNIVEYFENRHVKGISNGKEVIVLCPGGPYAHKALDTIPYLAKKLDYNYKDISFKFLLSIDESSDEWLKIKRLSEQLNISNKVNTTGSYNYANVNSVLEQADIIYVPSILETFSASYIEAFASKVPLVCADREFSKDVCGNAAVYLDPYNYEMASEHFVDLINSPEKQVELINNGLLRLSLYGDQKLRFEKVINYLNSILK